MSACEQRQGLAELYRPSAAIASLSPDKHFRTESGSSVPRVDVDDVHNAGAIGIDFVDHILQLSLRWILAQGNA